MKYTLEQLMQQVGCEKYPERWQEIFDTAMEEYDKNGCYLTDPAYYDKLHEQYGCMETYGDWYKKAAAQTAEEEALARFLTLLVMALQDDEHRKADISELALLKVPEGKIPLAYKMVTGLAVCSQLDKGNETLLKRHIPDEYRRGALKAAVDCGISTHMRRNEGEPGYCLLEWAQKYLEARLFTFGRLSIELLREFGADAVIYVNAKGEQVALAHHMMLHKSGFALGSKYFEEEEGSREAVIEETEDSWIGHPYQEDSYVSREKVCLKKEEWKQALTKGDPIINLHIPSGKTRGSFSPEAIDESFEAIRRFVADYFPDYHYKGYMCRSWLMDPQLLDLIGTKSNIGRFSSRFRKLTTKSSGNDVFNFVFGLPDLNFRLEELPERTSLEKALKAHYQNGRAIYEIFGYII